MRDVGTIGKMETTKFFGQECVALENRMLRLLVTKSVGPRILALTLNGGPNLLAELPDFTTECPGVGPFHFYGGHRLWHAPEDLNRTYLPDDAPVSIATTENGLLAIQDLEPRTGLQKSLELQLEGDAPQVVITHRILNCGLWPVESAPWAITQLKTGGTAILPQAVEETGVLPNRSMALWPYTDPSVPAVTWGQSYVLVKTELDAPFKIGFPNPRGWLGYWWGGTLFVKRAQYEAQATYHDYGSSSEFYCSSQFAELETLGPIQSILPGQAATHVERWVLYDGIDRPRDPQETASLVTKLGLG